MTVVLVPVPAIDPGLIVHVPVAGRPLSTTLPVGSAHEEGWVIVPTIGVPGTADGQSQHWQMEVKYNLMLSKQ